MSSLDKFSGDRVIISTISNQEYIPLREIHPITSEMSGLLVHKFEIIDKDNTQIGWCNLEYRYPLESIPHWQVAARSELMSLVECARVDFVYIPYREKRGKGYGTAVYRHIIEKLIPSIPLVSSAELTSEKNDGEKGSRELWESLVADGYAKKFVKNGKIGYISIPPSWDQQDNVDQKLEEIFIKNFDA